MKWKLNIFYPGQTKIIMVHQPKRNHKYCQLSAIGVFLFPSHFNFLCSVFLVPLHFLSIFCVQRISLPLAFLSVSILFCSSCLAMMAGWKEPDFLWWFINTVHLQKYQYSPLTKNINRVHFQKYQYSHLENINDTCRQILSQSSESITLFLWERWFGDNLSGQLL